MRADEFTNEVQAALASAEWNGIEQIRLSTSNQLIVRWDDGSEFLITMSVWRTPPPSTCPPP